MIPTRPMEGAPIQSVLNPALCIHSKKPYPYGLPGSSSWLVLGPCSNAPGWVFEGDRAYLVTGHTWEPWTKAYNAVKSRCMEVHQGTFKNGTRIQYNHCSPGTLEHSIHQRLHIHGTVRVRADRQLCLTARFSQPLLDDALSVSFDGCGVTRAQKWDFTP